MPMPPAAEALYFDNAPVAHIVQWRERERLAAIMARSRAAMRRAQR